MKSGLNHLAQLESFYSWVVNFSDSLLSEHSPKLSYLPGSEF